jgi:hypothetical protein
LSRLLAAIFLILPFMSGAAIAQQMSKAEIAAMIETQRRQVALDADGCPKYPKEEDEDVIVVCGEGDENRDQKVPSDAYDPDKIRQGQAVSTKRAGQCIGQFPQCRHRLHEVYGAGFGYVKPMAVDWDETMKGLPEPDMVVAEGTSEKERLAAETAEPEPETTP